MSIYHFDLVQLLFSVHRAANHLGFYTDCSCIVLYLVAYQYKIPIRNAISGIIRHILQPGLATLHSLEQLRLIPEKTAHTGPLIFLNMSYPWCATFHLVLAMLYPKQLLYILQPPCINYAVSLNSDAVSSLDKTFCIYLHSKLHPPWISHAVPPNSFAASSLDYLRCTLD